MRVIIIMFLFYCLPVQASELSDYKMIKCAIHIHTNISSGTRTIESYVKEAKERRIEAIILTDEDWRRWEYGLPPFRRLFKKVVQEKSVMTYGIKKYLNHIKDLNERYKDVVIIDGVQTNPFYYWSGNFFKGNLTLTNRNKDMLVIGFDSANDYRDMPLVVNRKSKFDAYHGDKFTQPYQDLINYVVEKGGLIFWSHPEFEEDTSVEGIRLITIPYQWDLIGTYDYTGYGIFWEGYQEIGKPGGIWDRILIEYCKGQRSSPIWAICELEQTGDKRLDDLFNVVFAKNLDRKGVLDALKKGRLYVVYNADNVPNRNPLVLEEFTISDESGNKIATMGEEIYFSGQPIIKIRISHERLVDNNITVRLIRNNEIIKEFNGNSRMEINYRDTHLDKDQKYYYRIEAEGNSRLFSNPIFFRKTSKNESYHSSAGF